MCRYILLSVSCFVLACCCLSGLAMADDGEAAAADEALDMTADDFLSDLGFDTACEEEVSEFLTWLYPLQPESERDMGLILSGSQWPDLDAFKVYFLWQYLQAAFAEAEPAWAGTSTGGSSSSGTIGYIGFSKTKPGMIYIMERLPTSSADVGKVPILAELDIGAFMAEQGYLTKADLTTVESLLRDVKSNQHSAFSVLSDLRASIGLPGSTSGTSVLNELALFRGMLQGVGPSVLRSIRSWRYDLKSNGLADIADDYTPYGIAELLDMNFKDLDQLLLKNLGQGFQVPYLEPRSGESTMYVSAGSSVKDYLGAIAASVYHSSIVGRSILGEDGVELRYSPNIKLGYAVSSSLLGLNSNMEAVLVGGHGGSAQYSKLVFDEQLNKRTEAVDYTDLLHAMVGIGSDLQNPLSQLQAVLASDLDMELHKATHENIEQVTEDFTGSGDGAVSTDQISDASGLTSGVGDAFGGNQVSTGDAFHAISDSGNFDFFSLETAAALDSVSYPAAALIDDSGDDWLSGYVQDGAGFYTVSDQTGWSLLDYLSGKEG